MRRPKYAVPAAVVRIVGKGNEPLARELLGGTSCNECEHFERLRPNRI